jgi:hypothetical protein
MTLVAVLDDKFPILFGDLLLSSPTTSNREVHLPAHDVWSADNAETGYSISRLSQKLCIISDHLAVGWSGPRIYAQTIVQEMRTSFKGGRSVSTGDLETFFQQIDYADPNVSMVGIALEKSRTPGEVKVHRFGWRAQKHTSAVFNEVRVCGYGTEHFLRALERVDASSLSAFDELPDHLKTLGKVLLLSGTLLGEEITTRSNLSSFYGGGFEFVSINAGKLEKIGDITYLFWGVKVISPEKLRLELHPVAVKFSYTRDILLVRRVEFTKPEANLEGLSRSKRDALFIVAPIYRNLEVSEREEIRTQTLPELEAVFYCHYFLVNFPNRPAQIISMMDKGYNMIKFEKKNGRVFLSANRDFVDRLLTAVRQRMA